MHCPYCRHGDSKVLDSRTAEDGGSIRRRRQCPVCERRFTTVEQMQLVVVKRSGVVEPFSRDKVLSGVRQALLHLHALGHRRIAYVGGPASSWSNRERLAAFLAVGADVTELSSSLRELRRRYGGIEDAGPVSSGSY